MACDDSWRTKTQMSEAGRPLTVFGYDDAPHRNAELLFEVMKHSLSSLPALSHAHDTLLQDYTGGKLMEGSSRCVRMSSYVCQ